MEVDLLRPDEISLDDCAEWNSLMTPGNVVSSPFLSPEWAILMARYRPTTRVVRIGSNDGVGFVAVEVHGHAASPVGAGLSDRQAIVASPSLNVNLGRAVRRVGLDYLRFDHLAGDHQMMEPFVSRRRGSPLIDLGLGVQEHLNALRLRGSGLSPWLRKQTRLAEREFGALNFVHGIVDDVQLDALMAAKSQQYRRTGAADLFAQQWVKDLARDIMATKSCALTGELSVLYAGDRAIAHHLGVRNGQVAHWWLPSFETDAGRCSPGFLLLMDYARHCEGLGVTEIDLGIGDEAYKRRIMSSERLLSVATVQALGLAPTLRRLGRRLKAIKNR
jgi:CelD/BcsL family acetyltransferase involved in cellulose biosynthesis